MDEETTAADSEGINGLGAPNQGAGIAATGAVTDGAVAAINVATSRDSASASGAAVSGTTFRRGLLQDFGITRQSTNTAQLRTMMLDLLISANLSFEFSRTERLYPRTSRQPSRKAVTYTLLP
jgi:hypothetical protein